ncbi:MAG: hypothetical protein F6J92_11255 [Symploca sp. SIO1A3]|nr:hypothetical protein [Symploca sp. SIO1A3]
MLRCWRRNLIVKFSSPRIANTIGIKHILRRRQEAEGWRQKAGGWRLEAGGRRQKAEGWRLEAEGWRLEAGGWRLEAGGWRQNPPLTPPRRGIGGKLISFQQSDRIH